MFQESRFIQHLGQTNRSRVWALRGVPVSVPETDRAEESLKRGGQAHVTEVGALLTSSEDGGGLPEQVCSQTL